MPNSEKQNKLIVRYAALAAGNLVDNQSIEPTDEMQHIATTLNMTHGQIIEAARTITLGSPTPS